MLTPRFGRLLEQGRPPPAARDVVARVEPAARGVAQFEVELRDLVYRLLRGEPHPGNLLKTDSGILFVDLETGCRGPVEYDLAHVPEEVSARYPDVDPELLSDCASSFLQWSLRGGGMWTTSYRTVGGQPRHS